MGDMAVLSKTQKTQFNYHGIMYISITVMSFIGGQMPIHQKQNFLFLQLSYIKVDWTMLNIIHLLRKLLIHTFIIFNWKDGFMVEDTEIFQKF